MQNKTQHVYHGPCHQWSCLSSSHSSFASLCCRQQLFHCCFESMTNSALDSLRYLLLLPGCSSVRSLHSCLLPIIQASAQLSPPQRCLFYPLTNVVSHPHALPTKTSCFMFSKHVLLPKLLFVLQFQVIHNLFSVLDN